MSKKTNSSFSLRTGSWFMRFLFKSAFFMAGIGLCGIILFTLAIRLVWPNLPDLDAMTDYRPRIPLRIYSADNRLLAEYGEERRNVLRIDEFPDHLKQAVLAAEDSNFYEHKGVNWSGVGRAVIANLTSGAKAQGASTITMQVARNFYLSKEKSFIRKFYELLLTYKIEDTLTKDQILELYLNQIYLGHRSYGFSAAARTYFSKPLNEISLAQAAVLAGIPKAPSINNPKTNLEGALDRQNYVLGRMLKLSYVDQEQYDEAKSEKIAVKAKNEEKENLDTQYARHSEYISELARQLMYKMYQENAYTRGLNVYTTVHSDDQAVAYKAVREGVLQYTRRKPYPGPEENLKLPDDIEQDKEKFSEFLDDVFKEHPDYDDLKTAIVLSADQNKVVVSRKAGETIELTGKSLNIARRALNPNQADELRIMRGSVIYLEKIEDYLSIINLPTVEGAFVALSPEDGAISSLIGGFDFSSGNFNRVTQAWRQPGSTFKPFIYAAGLERGLTPDTQISDQPFVLSAKQTGGKPWKPKNYGGRYTNSQSLRTGLYQSRNMISIRILEAVGADYSRDFITRFGFDLNRQPSERAYLTMALGAGSVTPLQLASAYAIFANGGYRVNPYLITHVTDTSGEKIMEVKPDKAGDESLRVLDERTAYVMNNLLHGVATSGTAARTTATLNRPDLHGKTGTTNLSVDAWFVGYTPKLVGVSWIGFDQPKSLGSSETGGKVAMPIWIDYMKQGLKDVPVVKTPPLPEGLKQAGNNFYYEEFPSSKAIAKLGVSKGSQEYTPVKKKKDSVGKAVDSFNPLGGAPIKF